MPIALSLSKPHWHMWIVVHIHPYLDKCSTQTKKILYLNSSINMGFNKQKPSHATVPLKVWPGSGYAWIHILEQIEMFCFCSDNKQTKSERFGFVPIISFDIDMKAQTFQYQSLLSEQNQNILIWFAYYRNKSRTFQSVPKLFKI